MDPTVVVLSLIVVALIALSMHFWGIRDSYLDLRRLRAHRKWFTERIEGSDLPRRRSSDRVDIQPIHEFIAKGNIAISSILAVVQLLNLVVDLSSWVTLQIAVVPPPAREIGPLAIVSFTAYLSKELLLAVVSVFVVWFRRTARTMGVDK